jgi:hypothetical protein
MIHMCVGVAGFLSVAVVLQAIESGAAGLALQVRRSGNAGQSLVSLALRRLFAPCCSPLPAHVLDIVAGHGMAWHGRAVTGETC